MKIVCIVDNTVLRVVPPLRVTDIINNQQSDNCYFIAVMRPRKCFTCRRTFQITFLIIQESN